MVLNVQVQLELEPLKGKEGRQLHEKAELIITGDWHLTRNRSRSVVQMILFPAQWKKLIFVKQMQEDLKCDVFHSGDLYDFWKP